MLHVGQVEDNTSLKVQISQNERGLKQYFEYQMEIQELKY